MDVHNLGGGILMFLQDLVCVCVFILNDCGMYIVLCPEERKLSDCKERFRFKSDELNEAEKIM